MKRTISLILIICFIAVSVIGCSENVNKSNENESNENESNENESNENESNETKVVFPERDIAGIIGFGAGGGTDLVMRSLSKYAEDYLGESIIIQNKTGGSGSVAAQFVYDGEPNGYSLYMCAENPAVYDAFEISKLTYNDFEPILLVGDDTITVYVDKNSPFNTFKELIDYQLANPGELTKTGSGPAGISGIAEALIADITGAKFTQYTIDSDASSLAAILGGHSDWALGKILAIEDYYEKGEIKVLTVLANERINVMPDVPPITDEFPEFKSILPFGSFYVVAVHKNTPKEIIEVLTEAFTKAFAEEEFQTVLKNLNVNPLGLTGEDAKEYIAKWRKNVVESLYNAGSINKTPAELGIK